MNKITSAFILLFSSLTANAGVLLDTGAAYDDSNACVAEGCYGSGDWWAISTFTADTDWNITGFEFFAIDTQSVGTTNYDSTSWKIYAAPDVLNFSSLTALTPLQEDQVTATTSQSTLITPANDTITVTSFLISNLDIDLAAGNYLLAQHHDFSNDGNFTIAATQSKSLFYNTDFSPPFLNTSAAGIAQKIYGTSIPEPALIALFGMGLLGLGWSRKKAV